MLQSITQIIKSLHCRDIVANGFDKQHKVLHKSAANRVALFLGSNLISLEYY